ncbi:MAG: hypothetical protein IT372_26940 [Polyangiaceae bacterium]|nr:hypothetical protein [Polyangiaceae bacterium]
MADRARARTWPRPGPPGGPRRGITLLAAAALLAACDGPTASPPAPVPSASAPHVFAPPAAPSHAAAAEAPRPASVPASAAPASNPFGLPPARIKLDPGRRVFTFSDRMLAGARPGSTLVLYAATVVGFEGDDLIIEGRGGPSYKVHPGYVIPVPDAPRVRLRDPVLTEWNGVMKHAVVTKFVKDRIGVRYTDMDARTPEGLLKDARFVRQVEGLAPGNYAALKEGDGYRHVLLVSRSGGGPDPEVRADEPRAAPDPGARWLALGYGGAALLVDEAALRPIPISPTRLKAGEPVLAEWVGALRRATIQSVDDTGLFTVKFERAGRPVRVGWGLITPPLDPAPAPR